MDDIVKVEVNKTPSMLNNNASCNGEMVAYAHKNEVITFKVVVGNSTAVQEKKLKPDLPVSKVFQVKWCRLSGHDYLVVGTGAGIVIYNATCTNSVFATELTSQSVPFPDPDASFVRGLTAVPETEYICAGTSTGHIFVLRVNEDSFELALTLNPHEDDDGAATSALAGSKQWFVAASDSGSVMIYDTSTTSSTLSFQRTARFPGTSPCTSLCISGEYVVSGYTTGQLKLFHLTTGVIFAEIGAHTRAITALDSHPDQPQFCSVGEDSVLTVWRISNSCGGGGSSTSSEGKNNQMSAVTVEFTRKVHDSLLTGVSYGTSNIITTSFDQRHVQIFTNNY
jgi:WD40 repeat protein